jgi:hypothetical protein
MQARLQGLWQLSVRAALVTLHRILLELGVMMVPVNNALLSKVHAAVPPRIATGEVLNSKNLTLVFPVATKLAGECTLRPSRSM